MELSIEIDFDCLLILPLLSVVSVKCDRCDEDHGWAVVFGWLFCTANLHFKSHDDEITP